MLRANKKSQEGQRNREGAVERLPCAGALQKSSNRRGLLLFACLLPGWLGCSAMHPLQGVPVRYMPNEFQAAPRSGKTTIDLSLLRQTPPPQYLLDSGDVLGIYIEGVLGRREEVPPVYFPENQEVAPSMGYPIPVREDGTVSLPLIEPITVRGMTVRQVEETIRSAYTQKKKILNVGNDRILVSLQRPRQYRILVIRQEAGANLADTAAAGGLNIGNAKRGSGRVVSLPAYSNDVLHALAETDGLPGLDAENTIYIIRNRNRLGLPPTRLPMPQPQMAPPIQQPSVPPANNQGAYNYRPTLIQQTSGYRSSRGGIRQAAYQPLAPRPQENQQPGRPPQNRQAPDVFAPKTLPPQTTQQPQYTAPQPPAGSPFGYRSQGRPSVAPPVNQQPMHQQPPYGQPMYNQPLPQPNWNQLPFNQAGMMLQTPTVESPNIVKIPVRLNRGEGINFREEDIILQDGDIVFIESRDTEIFYTGGLLGGGQYTLPRDYDLDVLGAVSIAQAGANSQQSGSSGGVSALNQDVTISASDVVILRQLPNGTQVPIKVDLYKALRSPQERIIIQPGDYIILQYKKSEAIGAFIERHLLEGALFGLAAAQFQGG